MDENQKKTDINRRTFLKGSAAGAAFVASSKAFSSPLKYFTPTVVDNPLAYYPNRDWEFVYRNIFKHDSEFHFLCAPNDTHNCLLKTFVKETKIDIKIGIVSTFLKFVYLIKKLLIVNIILDFRLKLFLLIVDDSFFHLSDNLPFLKLYHSL